MSSHWRLLGWDVNNGATNMAVDEAILRSVEAGQSPPTLRLYGWSPPCLSIGFGQRVEDTLDIEACERAGYDWVRRPTGGRALLHRDEVTYSLVIPLNDPLSWGGILGSYERISRGLLDGLRELGAEVEFCAPRPSERGLSAACFDQPASYEITWKGRKLVGSAQVRRRRGMLQHGSIPLRGDVDGLVPLLRLDPWGRSDVTARLRGGAVTLGTVLGRDVAESEVVQALVRGFSRALGVALEEGVLSPAERQWAMSAGVEKYGGSAWNLRGRRRAGRPARGG